MKNSIYSNASARQISIWENSLVTVYDREGYPQYTREAGEALLLSLDREGFTIDGGKVITVAGITIQIHCKSLRRALLLKYREEVISKFPRVNRNAACNA